ncbi:MAG: alpha-D-glucose phosphate-specific phosphoglucomutase [Rhodocyclaceae bacterium]|nr:MAG: alpha-D-glucose phosphate-specific phosphoglucomutase [Rhodocyclaceae bacterium]
MPTSHPHAGKPAQTEHLIDTRKLIDAYHATPGGTQACRAISFGTSGHRGSSLDGSFNECHVIAIAQAVCDYRRQHHILGPVIVGKDTHLLSEPAQRNVIEVLAANDVTVQLQKDDGYTPTPVVSHAILAHNRYYKDRADGIILTPSHNPPQDGGIKYNPPNGGPADSEATGWIESRANALMTTHQSDIRRIEYPRALALPHVQQLDLGQPYIDDLVNVIDMDAIRAANLKIGVAPLGGASLHYWKSIAARYGLHLEIIHPTVDPTFSFMPLDHDGKIRMDCSSPYAMAGLVAHADRYTIAWGNDPDADRHGIVTPNVGLMNPNHYLAVALHYLATHRPSWPIGAAIGKTLVTSHLLDTIAADLERKVFETPVGFKWFAAGLFDGSLCFAGEESAGASLLKKDGGTWTTDKDGIVMGLLAAEITAVTGKNPGTYHQELVARYGAPDYVRIDLPIEARAREALKHLDGSRVQLSALGDEPILARQRSATGNGADIGGIKVVTENGWFAARPSGTEDMCKLYAESFKGPRHLETLVKQAKMVVDNALENPWG